MGALRREAAVESLSIQLLTEVRERPGEPDARRLEQAWAAVREALADRLLLDEALHAASLDFEATLKALREVRDEAALQQAMEDLRHHIALLEDLLASSPLPPAP